MPHNSLTPHLTDIASTSEGPVPTKGPLRTCLLSQAVCPLTLIPSPVWRSTSRSNPNPQAGVHGGPAALSPDVQVRQELG